MLQQAIATRLMMRISEIDSIVPRLNRIVIHNESVSGTIAKTIAVPFHGNTAREFMRSLDRALTVVVDQLACHVIINHGVTPSLCIQVTRLESEGKQRGKRISCALEVHLCELIHGGEDFSTPSGTPRHRQAHTV